jgi:putative transcriptional regulator
MIPVHHPGDDLLVAHAAGSSGEGLSLLVATHLALCAPCRRKLADAEVVGGALLSDIAPARLERSVDEALVLLGPEVLPPKAAPPRPPVRSTTPEPLRSYLGGDIERVRWTAIAPGVSFRPVLHRGGARMRLVRTAPGAGIGLHTHRGEELTLVLAGSFSDDTGHYRRGDVQTATPDLQHRPVTDRDSWCVSLTLADAPLKFASPALGLLAKAFGF